MSTAFPTNSDLVKFKYTFIRLYELQYTISFKEFHKITKLKAIDTCLKQIVPLTKDAEESITKQIYFSQGNLLREQGDENEAILAFLRSKHVKLVDLNDIKDPIDKGIYKSPYFAIKKENDKRFFEAEKSKREKQLQDAEKFTVTGF